MAKQTVAQVAPLFQDFDMKLRVLDGLLFEAFLVNRDLITMVRSNYDPGQEDDHNTH